MVVLEGALARSACALVSPLVSGMTVFDIAVEGGWRDLKMVQRYTKSRPFEELQRLPTPLSFVLQKRAS